jgi:serine phosphatase RsbU (regulator of sigma subunit)
MQRKIKQETSMMSDEQLEDFISQMHDFLEDKQEECGVTKIEVYSTVLAVALGGIRREAMKTGDVQGVEEDLAAMGIILEKVNAEDLEDLLQDYDPPEKIIH